MDYIFKPMSYVLVILLGYLLKRAGFFGQNDHRMMSRIMVNITLPCTIVQAFDGFERDAGMFVIVGIGLLCAFVPILLMYLTTGGVEKRLRAYRMLNIGGYNRESVGDILMKFVKSLPFDAYMMMILLAALDVKLPSAVFTLTRPAGQANAFIAMMMIGMMFEPAGDKALLRETARELLGRYLFAAVSAALVFFCTPFELVVRQTLCIVCFAPLSSLAPIYTDRCHGDTALASFTNSVSIAVSLVIMLALGLGFVL